MISVLCKYCILLKVSKYLLLRSCCERSSLVSQMAATVKDTDTTIKMKPSIKPFFPSMGIDASSDIQVN